MIDALGDVSLIGEHQLSLELASVDYPSGIEAISVSVGITVIKSCTVTSLVDDESVNFSALHPVDLPLEDYRIALPILQPEPPCDGELSNADVQYSLVMEGYEGDGDTPEWAVFKEDLREVILNVQEEADIKELTGKSRKFTMTATLALEE